MKYFILTTALFLANLLAFAQEDTKEKMYLMQTDDEVWGKEIFQLPTGFAREMTLKGFEDASFPPEWSNPESPQMWSYIFAWSVASDSLITMQELEANLDLYFDGLMGAKKDSMIDGKLPSTSLLVQTSSTEKANTFTGKVRTFDRFRSNKMMTLNLLVEQSLCESSERVMIVFRFSPKALDHKIWEFLKTVPLRGDACTQG